jgi:hypothetical protein
LLRVVHWEILSAFLSETKANRPFDASNLRAASVRLSIRHARRLEDLMLFLYMASPVDYTPADVIPKHTG